MANSFKAARCCSIARFQITRWLEAISKIGFWFKIAAVPIVKPEDHISILRI
jgi:hypothetical protein